MEEAFMKKSICLFMIFVFAFSVISALPVLAEEEGGDGGEPTVAEEPNQEPAPEPVTTQEPEPVITPEPGPEPEPQPCPPAPQPGPCIGELIPEYDNQGCLTGHRCKQFQEVIGCPLEPGLPACGPGENRVRDVDKNGCTTGYHCEGMTQEPCPPAPDPPACGPDERLEADHDNRGCLVNYFCKYSGEKKCPREPPKPGCNKEDMPVADFDRNGCLVGWHCEYRGGEGPEPMPMPECRVDDVCPDGVTRPCRWEGDRCVCDPCPPPQGCREVRDPKTGYVHVVCETKTMEQICPSISEDEKMKCEEAGGRPEMRRDNRGCEFISCEFGENQYNFYEKMECPSDEEMEMVKEKCRSMGMPDVVIKDGGCFVVKCQGLEERPWEEQCPPITYEQKQAVFERCESIGKTATQAWDESGCMYLKCAEAGECLRLPEDAFRKCEEMGGELVAKDDENGCVVWHECVMRGNEDNVYYERPERMPETTELLEMAFKLESLKMELDKLARKSDAIADYYQAADPGEEERFRRVADMFQAAKGKVDEIKNKIRERLEDMTMDDVMEIKHDIQYIKDVVIKDILYVMLSSGEDIKDRIEGGNKGSCGTDGSCFDRAIRVCEPVEFMPEGSQGPIVHVAGLEGDTCIIDVRLPEGQGPPGTGALEMKCKIQNYAMGIRGEQDILPYCEGPLKDVMEQYGTGPGETEELVMCSPEDERAMKECANKGGRPQSDPAPQGCEKYTGCEMPGSGGGGGGVMPCSGCLDNGVCDPGECSDCRDCMGGGF